MSHGKVVELNGDEEFNKLLADSKLCVVDFWAPWCGPCKTIKPKFAELSSASEYSEVKFASVDTTKNEELAEELDIDSLPTFRFYRAGKQVDELQGADPADLIKKLKSLSGGQAAKTEKRPREDAAKAAPKAEPEVEAEPKKEQKKEVDYSKVAVHITYCGGWGYSSRFRRVQNELAARLPGIRVTGQSTPSTTGWFEVQVKGGPLVHSKKAGMGHLMDIEPVLKQISDWASNNATK